MLVGYCDGLAAGAHTLQVFVQNSPNFAGSQCFTGWVDTGAATTLEALEIDHFEVIVTHCALSAFNAAIATDVWHHAQRSV